MKMLASSDIFLFDDFRLDQAGGGLFQRDDQGAFNPVAIGSRALNVLAVLVERRGDVVSKDEIIAAVWPETVVEEGNLFVQISALRRGLDRERSGHSCIQTVIGRGYRFIAPVTRCAVGADPGPPPSPHEHLRVLSGEAVKPAVLLADARSLEPQPSPISSAERRQLTMMICDLVGSTALSSRLDPEDLREIIAAYHRAVAEIVVRFDGFVAKYIGDGVLIYFGYPRAHEDDAERAVRVGLGLIDAIGHLDVSSFPLQARVGIATGLVVVGDLVGEGSAQERSVVGETPHLTARLQTLADPDAVVIAAGTHQLVGDLFEYRDLGAVEVTGIAAPVQAWQVLRPSAIASRFEALRGSALSPLVGRDEEIDLLLRRWARVKTGDGQIVLVSGEPGLGKSRLTAALEERLHTEPHLRLRYFCSPYHQDSALFPFIDQLSRASGFARDDPPAAKLESLKAVLALAAPPQEDVAFFADLLSLPASERHPLPNLSPQRKKERTLEALIRQLEGWARQMPVVVFFEDAHWIDPTSRELLDLAVERVRSLPVLLIVTFRPEFQAPWTGQSQVSMLALNRLDRNDRSALVAQIAAGKALPDEVVAQIVERSDGVPLFIEELTKSVLESDVLREEVDRYVLDRALPPPAIPTTLHDSLMARLDRLVSVRHVAQIGAAIGREFSYALLHEVSRLSEDELQTSLARLVASELVFQRGAPPEAVYTFKHALVQDAAHGSLLRGTRQQLHAQIAEALETLSPELTDSQPELFAQHYAEAGLIEKSVACWGKAGHRSAASSAMAEAAAQFRKGLGQLALLPNEPQRQRQELEFWSALGFVFLSLKGHAAPETGDAYARARELWERLGCPAKFLHIPYGQSLYYMIRREPELARRSDEDLLRLSRQRNDSVGLVLGHLSSGRNLLMAGQFQSSRTHLEEMLALYDPCRHRPLMHLVGDDPYVVAQGSLGLVLLALGYPGQASRRTDLAVAEARRLSHPPSLAGSLVYSGRLHTLAGNDAALEEHADEMVVVTTEQDFPHWHAIGTVYRGWARLRNGHVAEGISLLSGGSTAALAAGTRAWRPFFLSLLARAQEIAGQVDEAAALLDDALASIEETQERWLEAEVNRHKGRLLLRQGHRTAAEEIYRKALSISREQDAKFWELRAAMSLARLWGEQGRRAEARELLAPVYGWFIEGFDTADMKEAAALLSELA
jgi:class 3 adenylate cyclase/predicted ATPase